MTDRISPNLASAHLQVSQEGAPQVEPYEMPLLYPAILIILYSIRGLLRYSEIKRRERIKRHILQKQEGVKIIKELSNRDILMIGLGLYWGEGYKYENGEFGFTNSNPLMIHFYFKWLKLWDVEKNSLVFRLTLNEFFRKEENNIKLFWINFLGIKKEQFSKTTFIKTSLKKASLKNILKYKGILRVKVRKGTLLRNKILGAIEHISSI
ncbi:MAG: hypothetical protein US45_C0059G0005 [Candidatus Nomurabacteria bacterium GW2011_GWA1_37_20]|uniref:Homing endonuclease LAGLIDADG domain-containing protein n=1 Tax=Candidatus Nomurabacteria bacterium GW2011_GWA1_37_20 TaxID=1618729 RepID=A0A0G0GTV2_9BACT|nr:MAG: hypothetical protein US45_C0059G0005 [Candidatus Nomurabacteria bacterium GW2011_GWA1_37_20]